MPLSWTISHPQRLVIAVARDEVAPHEFGTYLEAMQPVGGYRKIFVVSGMSTVFDTALLQSVGRAVRDHAAREPLGPIAIVVDNAAAHASAMVYADAVQGLERPIRIFREQHEARRWLDGFVSAETGSKD
jgi:16S rRNA C1402 (ribose-2'-O) methylase RsmI